jgi:hypothetical protein
VVAALPHCRVKFVPLPANEKRLAVPPSDLVAVMVPVAVLLVPPNE